MSESEKKNVTRNLGKQINKYMNRIASKLGIKSKITTYVARHTFSTVLRNSGASTELISEMLAHSSLSTTKNYLDSFEDSVKLKHVRGLTDF